MREKTMRASEPVNANMAWVEAAIDEVIVPGMAMRYIDWVGSVRVVRCYGQCCGCGVGVWGHDDGRNDPRGVLGDHALWPIEVEDAAGGEVELSACAVCANDFYAYKDIVFRWDTGSEDERASMVLPVLTVCEEAGQ